MKSFSVKATGLFFTLLLLVSCGGGGGGSSNGSTNNLPDLAVTAFSGPSAAIAGGTYTVIGTITNKGGIPSAGASAVVYLSPNSNVAVDGGQVGLDVYMGILDVGQSWNFSISITLPTNIANGSYYLGAVAAYANDADTSNNTRSQPITITGGTTCSPDSYETDNSAAAAKAIALGESQQHNHCDATSDWMSFSAIAGQAYGVVAQTVGDKASLLVSVYDKDGSTRFASTSSPWAVLSRMTWTAPANGTYYLKVSPYSGTLSSGANTDYRVTLEDTQHPDFITDSFWFQGSGMPGGIINVSDNVRNQGFADATNSFDVSVYISQSPVVTAATGTLIGTRTVSSLAAGQSNAGSWMDYSLPLVPDGTYYLATIANPSGANETVTSNNTSIVLPITIQAPTGCTADSYEPDSTYTAANTIVVGADPQAHNHCQDSSDWLKFTAEAGKDYSIRVARTGGYSYACVQLYDTDGSTLLAGDCNNSPTAIDWHAATAGTYYLDVIGYATGPGTDYTIKLQPQLPDLTQAFSSNWTTAVAGGFLDVYDTVSNIGYAAAGPFDVGVYSSASGSVTTADTLLATRSVTGLPVQTSPWNYNQASYSLHFPVTMPTGTYYIAAIADTGNAVTELNENNNTSTPIAVSVVAPPCAVDAYEDDDDPASAKPISAGETQSRNFCDDSLDWVSFTPTTSGAYVVSSGSGYIDIYQADGVTRIPSQDTGSASTVSWVATANTKYYLKIYNGTGAYQLTAYSCPQDAYEEDDSPSAAHLITVGETQPRNFCEDRDDWAKFDAVQGTTYTISSTNGTNVWLKLYDTTGTSILTTGQSGSGQTKGMSLITWTAPASGTYYIGLTPFWGVGQNTGYSLSLN